MSFEGTAPGPASGTGRGVAVAARSSPFDAVIIGEASFLVCVGLISAAVIAAQISIMRVFSIGNWAHFGSLIIAIAMAGFGLASAVMCVAQKAFERHAAVWGTVALLAFGPLIVLGNAGAQSLGFNPIFLAASTGQFWILAGTIGFYFMPFFAAALFLGSAFMLGAKRFGRVYFSDLLGAGLAGLLALAAMTFVPPTALLMVPVALWLLACLAWAAAIGRLWLAAVALALALGSAWFGLTSEPIATSSYKGVSYARHFPDAQRIYENWGPQGYLEIYSSSYFHFAPGLSDMAAIDLPTMPENAYLGLYIDGDGPIGLMKPLSEDQQAYFRYLPMAMPYLLRPHAKTFVVQFGGGISTRVALGMGAGHVDAAEPNPLIPTALRSPGIAPLIGNILADPRITLIPTEGRIAIAGGGGGFDVVDLSLVDSTGLSSPGGLSVVEKYAYTRQAMVDYMRALAPGGLLSVTVWNKENPPKAVPKLLATLRNAAATFGDEPLGRNFFIVHTYLSTATILYRKGGFTPEEIATLEAHAKHMAFDVVWTPGQPIDASADRQILEAWQDPLPTEAAPAANTEELSEDAGTQDGTDTAPGKPKVDMSTTALYRAMADGILAGDPAEVQRIYGFSMSPVTDDHPYLAGYIKPKDILRAIRSFDLISDDWGFLLLWVSLAQSLIVGTLLIVLPAVFGWRAIFSRQPGKLGLLGYFACLGLGYILVEITLIAKFVRVLGNPTVSVALMITGMLVLSGVGSLFSSRIQPDCRRQLPRILLAVFGLLAVYAIGTDLLLNVIGRFGYGGRIACALAVAGLPALLMGFALPTAMSELKRLGKEPFFLWAWGINGLFSVGGAVAAPLIGVVFGLDTALWIAAFCYLGAIPCFFSVVRPRFIGA